MNGQFKNPTLAREMKEIIEKNLPITKGTVGGQSILTETVEPRTFSSYTYRNKKDRDADFELALSFIHQKIAA